MRSQHFYIVRTATSNVADNYAPLTYRGTAGWNATRANREVLWPSNGVLKRWKISLSSAPGGGSNYAFTIFKNGASTGHTITISGANTEGQKDDELSLAAGDIVCVRSSPSSAPAAVAVRWGFVFEDSVIGQIPFPCGIATTVSTTSNLFSSALGGINWSAGGAGFQQQNLCPQSGTFKNMYANLNSAPGASNTCTFTVRKNGTAQALQVNISDANTTGSDTSNSFTVAAGDLLDVEYDVTVGGAWGASKIVNWGMVFVPDDWTRQAIMSGNNSDAATGTQNYSQIQNPGAAFNGTEASTATLLAQNCRIRDLYAQLETAPGSGSWDFEIFKDGSVTALVVNGVTATTLQSNTTDVVEGVEAGTLNFNVSPNSPGGVSKVAWGVDYDVYVPGVQSRCMMGCGI